MTYDDWKTTAPDPGTVEDVDGCADCGDLACSCDVRCWLCGQRFTSEADAEAGVCWECQIDAAAAAAEDWAYERGRL